MHGCKLLAQHLDHHLRHFARALQGLIVFGDWSFAFGVRSQLQFLPKAGELFVVVTGKNPVNRISFLVKRIISEIEIWRIGVSVTLGPMVLRTESFSRSSSWF